MKEKDSSRKPLAGIFPLSSPKSPADIFPALT